MQVNLLVIIPLEEFLPTSTLKRVLTLFAKLVNGDIAYIQKQILVYFTLIPCSVRWHLKLKNIAPVYISAMKELSLSS